ncbi:hypothetical protein MMA231_03743 (plasmid) [Asticcacaulis sp. MM231]|uniref:TonB-dependent receptor family protein n=1 Tax=Asticcacaulis sp. MM231 TaxID=3157666 RepID=UPI0032D5ABEF
MKADGYRTHSKQDQTRASLNVGYTFGEEQEVRLIVTGADINQEVPGTLSLNAALTTPENAGAGVEANDWARDQKVGRMTVQTHWRLSDDLVFEGGIYATATSLHHPISIVIDQEIHTQGLFGRFDWNGTLGGHKADLFYGLSYRQGTSNQGLYVNMGGQSGFQFGRGHQEASGLDIFAEGRYFTTEKLAVVLGASYGKATRDYTDRLNATNNASKDFNWFAPRIGLLWQGDTGTQIYANITQSVEPPHYGALVQSPVPQFVPVRAQKAVTGELGTRGKSGVFTWDVTLYRAQIKGELLSFSAATGYPAAFFNARNTVHQGLEASLDWRAPVAVGKLVVRQTYAYSDFRFDNDPIYGDGRLPVVPEHQYRIALNYAHPSGFFVEPAIDWRLSKVYVDYANTLKAPGYALLNLNTGWKLKSGVTLYIDARNLTDEKYVAEFGAVTDARTASTDVFYPGEGRSVFAGVAYRF